MPIVGRTARECINAFRSHLSSLVADTIAPNFMLGAMTDFGEPHAPTMLGFLQGEDFRCMPIRTHQHGTLWFYLSQAVSIVKYAGQMRLTTNRYWYRLQRLPGHDAHALMRWEFEDGIDANRHCRNHLQVAAQIPTDGEALDLNRLHLPTGRVTIEEVIRFLIVDLGHRPPCGKRWPQVLVESERQFFEQYMGRDYKPAMRSRGPR